ncbi:MAG: glycosyltransferase [Balneola sp.]
MLSIVIPTLNEEAMLPGLIHNIHSTGIEDMEIIVSDGNSDDLTQKITKELGCRVVTTTDRHPSFQRNNGAKIAKREIILFLDADTKLPDDFIKNAISKFEKRRLDVAGFFIRFD